MGGLARTESRASRGLAIALVIAIGLAAALAAARPAWAQLDKWTLLRPRGRLPQGLVGAASVHDPGNHRMLVFAGTAWEEDHEEVQNAVWALDLTEENEEWSLLRPYGHAPHYRRRPAAAYDGVGERMLVFGGFYEEQRGYYHDTWLLDFQARPGGEWIEHPRGAPHPEGRMAASLVVQQVPAEPEPVHRAILFGGYSATDRGQAIPYNDVWAFDFRDGHEGWAEIEPAGDPPKTRDGHSAIYDEARNRMIVFGGWHRERRVLTTLDDVWALDLTPGAERWTELQPDGRPLAVAWHSAMYDPCPGHERMLVFGGYNYTGDRSTSDVWALSLPEAGDGAWTRLDTTGARPTPRDSHVAQYDPIARRLVVFSGWDGPGKWKRDSWLLDLLPCASPTATATWGIDVPTTAAPPPTVTGGAPTTTVPPTGTPSATTAVPGVTATASEPTPTVETGTPSDCADAYEPDEIWYQAKEIATGESQARTFHVPGDRDFAKFTGRSGRHYRLRTDALAARVDTRLALYATDGVTLLDENDDDPGAAPASRIEWTCPADGTYFVSVQDVDAGRGGCDMRYVLELSEGVPPTATAVPSATVPRQAIHMPFAEKVARGPTPTPLPQTHVCNPGFESGAIGDCWVHGGELPQRVVDRLDDDTLPAGGRYALLLGDPSLGGGNPGEDPVPVGSAWAEQMIDVPASGRPMLSFVYRIVTHDMVEQPTGTLWDMLAVSVEGEDVFIDGNRTAPDLGVRHEIGWRTQDVDLSPWRGETIVLRFASWNGRNGAPGAEWYNTWSYVDNVVIDAR